MYKQLKQWLEKRYNTLIQIVSTTVKAQMRETEEPNPYCHLSGVLNKLLLIYLPIAIMVNTLRYAIFPTDLPSLVVITIIGIIGVFLSIGLRQGVYYRASVYNSFTLAFLIGYLSALTTSPPHQEIILLVLIPIIGVAALSRREVVIVTCITVILIFVFLVSNPEISPQYRRLMMPFTILLSGFILFANYQRNRLEAKRQELAIEKEKSIIIKELIGNVSHDFRTPLSTIHTSVYLLQKIEQWFYISFPMPLAILTNRDKLPLICAKLILNP